MPASNFCSSCGKTGVRSNHCCPGRTQLDADHDYVDALPSTAPCPGRSLQGSRGAMNALSPSTDLNSPSQAQRTGGPAKRGRNGTRNSASRVVDEPPTFGFGSAILPLDLPIPSEAPAAPAAPPMINNPITTACNNGTHPSTERSFAVYVDPPVTGTAPAVCPDSLLRVPMQVNSHHKDLWRWLRPLMETEKVLYVAEGVILQSMPVLTERPKGVPWVTCLFCE
jgi:hypothetical protein